MNLFSKQAFCFFLLFFFFCKPSKTQEKVDVQSSLQEDKKITLLGRILSGLAKPKMHVEISYFDGILQNPIYEQHYQQMQHSWNKAEEIRLQKIREWANQELRMACEKDHTIFYPFSGPDVLHVQILFPCGKSYILFGLEPPGEIRDLSTLNSEDLKGYLAYIQKSLYSILHYSFFRTNDMKIDFFKKLDGIAPILLTFLVYNQSKIVRITNLSLLDGHTLVENKSEKGIPGIRIYYIDSKSLGLKTISYFQIDVSNSNLERYSFFIEHLKKNSPYLSFVKAASYLMHRETFSNIRDFILEHSILILQDDSGIPFKYFQSQKWELIFYGNYVEPIPLFRSRFQQDLKKVYLNKNFIRPLPFGTGYNFYPGTSNLLLALDKNFFKKENVAEK